MRLVVRATRLKPTAKNTVGGTISRNSLITNARRRDLGMNGFLSTRDRMSGAQLELFLICADAQLYTSFLFSSFTLGAETMRCSPFLVGISPSISLPGPETSALHTPVRAVPGRAVS